MTWCSPPSTSSKRTQDENAKIDDLICRFWSSCAIGTPNLSLPADFLECNKAFLMLVSRSLLGGGRALTIHFCWSKDVLESHEMLINGVRLGGLAHHVNYNDFVVWGLEAFRGNSCSFGKMSEKCQIFPFWRASVRWPLFLSNHKISSKVTSLLLLNPAKLLSFSKRFWSTVHFEI